MPVFLAYPYHTKSGRRPAIEPPYKSGPEPYSFVTLHENRAGFLESVEHAVPMVSIRRLRGYGNPQPASRTDPTVRNGRAVSPQGRLPSAPLLTGLSPRCIARWACSAPPLCQRSLLVSALSCAIRIRNPLEFTTPKRPLSERGGSAQALTEDCRIPAACKRCWRESFG